ncbi:resistance-nodulation-cell division (RND) efflux transporter [Steroidobacter agaridevorans]|uniref:Resistance-nodulation-cell division (RND) efflux transporter n=1 Tax=Steroidobacter agaridevorans TaxID=2695856 RepID=A0A829Y7G9_9GAMM|nr:multidrug efflux RND transporter permease subunit [Steroidobacter agaridevorans]GFE78925.1 resistance-nodulation-cell division (RND) efflux transporter [Steroidobacter agaridevorans]
MSDHLPAQASRAQASLTRPGLSDWFIKHPIGTTLLTIGIVLLGIVAFPLLPVAPMPEAELPTMQISANLPGASPETMASAVATPLEVQLSSVPGITDMTSSSTLGSTSITLQFVLNKDIDVAAQEVQAAINAASGRLPADLPNLPTWRKVNPNDGPILVVRMQSDLMPLTELSDIAETVVGRQLSQIEGVAETPINGQRKPAMRIQAAPEKLAALGLTLADLRQAIQAASVNQAKGALFGADRVSTLQTNDQIFTTQDYDNLIVAYRANAPVFLRDVATVTFGAENEYVQAWQNGKPGIHFVIRRQPGANIVATADRIREALPELQKLLPASVELEVINDRTRTIRASLHEVEVTLVVTALLVIVIMGVFLRQLSATAIVAAVLAVALLTTVGAMYLLGFSLNNLTLVALVVAVGFVVDDAIVVVENIHRHLEAGESMLNAARQGAAEIGFTVVSISFSLIAAFVPLLFMGGVVGRLFREFAVTMTVAILISVVASLTLAPMLASRFMKPMKHHAEQGLAQRLIARYDRALQWALAHQRTVLVSFGATVAVAVLGYVFIPKGFFPLQDTAFIFVSTQGAEDISFEDMKRKQQVAAGILAQDPAVQAIAHVVGGGLGSSSMASGRIFVVLKDRGDRDVSAEEFIGRMRPKLMGIPGLQMFMRTSQDINLGAGGGRAQYLYVLRGPESGELAESARRLAEKLRDYDQLRDVSDDLQLGASVTRLTIDRAAAARFGLRTVDIDQVLYDAFGQRQISEYQTETNQYKVVLEIDPSQRGRAESLQNFYLRSPLTGQMVPLAAVARMEAPDTGPLSITHDGMFPSVTLSFNLAPGVALGEAVTLIEQAQAELGMPATISGNFRGTAQEFQKSLATQPLLILGALIAVYIILGVLYESFVHPLTILSTLPSAGVGAVLALWLTKTDFSIMALIGVVLLIGIVKKNGILMVDFALERQRKDGLSPLDAIHEACLVRFRPIIMTTLAAMLGAIPLMLGFGTGSELRQPLGVAIFGGLVISQILTLFSTPVIYLALDRVFHRKQRETQPAISEPLSHPEPAR